MSDEPKVELVSDNLEKNQWGKSFFFFKEGKKLSLNTKRASMAMGVCAVVLIFVQLSYEAAPSTSGGAPISVATQAATTPSDVLQVPPLPGGAERGTLSVGAGRDSFRKLTGPQVVGRPRNLAAIPPGAMIQAALVSGASNGLVRAEVKERLTVNGETLLEEGTVLVGSGSSTEERLLVRFQQAVFRDGTFGNIDGHACDSEDKIVGLKGSKIGNKALNIAGSIGLGFVGGLTEGLQETQGQQGAVVRPPSMKNALLNATATTALEQSRNLMGELKDRTPIIEVPPGTQICVLFGGGR